MKRPRDKKGVPIMPGDVLKMFHFIGARNKRHYMYKIAHDIGEFPYAAHAHLIPEAGLSLGNSFALPRDGRIMEHVEIVEGFNGGDFEKRKRKGGGEVTTNCTCCGCPIQVDDFNDEPICEECTTCDHEYGVCTV